MKKCEQLQWHECWDCEDYNQSKLRCDKLNIQKARNSYSTCLLFRPRDLEKCETCRWYYKDLHRCVYSALFIDPVRFCNNYEYKYKENK